MSGEVVLTVTTGNAPEKAFVFNSHETFLFGRVDDCHICLPEDRQVSRHHFLMEVNPPQVCIRDLGSRNGTYINKQKYGGRSKNETPEEGAKHDYPQVELHDGDEIRVGRTVLRVQVKEAAGNVSNGQGRGAMGGVQAQGAVPPAMGGVQAQATAMGGGQARGTVPTCRNCGRTLDVTESGQQQEQLCSGCQQQ